MRGWGEILCFIYVFVIMHTVFSTSCLSTSNSCSVHVAENVQQRPLGSHFSVGRRIRCNTGSIYSSDPDALNGPTCRTPGEEPQQQQQSYRPHAECGGWSSGLLKV
ncbi:unnamed protein product [Arctogadus glacialis]